MPRPEPVYFSSILLDLLQYSIKFLHESSGVFLLVCTFLCVLAAFWAYPKKQVKFFFIGLPIFFIIISLFFKLYLHGPSGKLSTYMKDLLNMSCYGIAFTPIFISFYWLSVGVSALLSLKKPLTTLKKYIYSTMTSLLLWLFVYCWEWVATFLLFLTFK